MLIGAFCTIYLPLRFRKIKVKVFFTCAERKLLATLLRALDLLGEYRSVAEICLTVSLLNA